MRKAISVVIGALSLLAAAHTGRAVEMTWEFSVQASASVQVSPAQITLSWPQDQYMTPNSYTIYRKGPADTSWGSGTGLPGSATSYTDRNVVVGTPYEYQIVKSTTQYTSYGYVYSGINVPMTDSRGKLLLVVDNTYAANLAGELARLQQDLVGDGWTVIRLNVGRNDSVASVKSKIKEQYAADPANVKCVFLFGHVPVPYSGNIVPDGHTPDHQGAWPCDGFYGDMDGTWTDNSVNVTGQYDSRNTNVPGDGKYDQSTFPAPIKLMVGRVDLANMPGELWYGGPTTMPSELELLRNYLNKDHNFRTKQFDLPRRAIVGDFFGVRNGEAFAASGWRNFAPFVGANEVTTISTMGAWTPTLKNTPYLWAYGCGAGSFTSVAGLGNSDSYYDVTTPELYTNDIKAVFTLLFGSWLGDFDAKDNIMRTVLASPSYGLTCAWSGRPHWFLHHMALGEPIGFGARLTQNNAPNGLYQNQINSAAGQIHIALMGDPSLRMHVVAPPSNVTAQTNGASVNLSWNAANDTILGYHVYRAGADGSFTRLTTSPVSGITFTDTSALGAANYMVRSVKLETSASGTYYNPSEGAFLNATAVSGGISGTNNDGGNNGGTTSDPGTNAPGTNLPPTGSAVWVDDALPSGGVPGTDGGDIWNWVSANPAPFSGSLANQSTLNAGFHQHFFSGATQTLNVNTGNSLYAYVYLDPNNPPSEVMLQWNDGSWDHRAYWGADNIGFGLPGTVGHVYMGPLPASGQWVLLQVPASKVGLEGKLLNGMAFSQFDGMATWDAAGRSAGTVTNTPPSGGSTNTPPNNGGTNTTTNGSGGTNSPTIVAWVDDALPTGASSGSDGGDQWNWVSSNPNAFSGSASSQSSLNGGLHQHYFEGATQTLSVNTGDYLFAYVFIDPNNVPSELMLQWNDGVWDHRAFWGANNIDYGTPGTAGRVYMGPVPAAGQWVLLQVPASKVGLEGSTINGMAFSQFDGRATWDYAGKASGQLTSVTPPSNGGTTNDPGTNSGGTAPTNIVAWVDDALPAGAQPGSEGGDIWNWITAYPTPFSGNAANQSTLSSGLHQHFFSGASQTLTIGVGDYLLAYVYVDPNNIPSEIMLQWNDGAWEHRAFWGADNIGYGVPNTTSRAYMGPMPAAGRWVLLQVPASAVGLEGKTINGMAFSQYDGRATWDYAGKASAQLSNPPPSGGGTNTTTTPSGGSTLSNAVAWVDDALPAGATPATDGGDVWNWVSSNPTAFSGRLSNQSTTGAGLHQHFFTGATQTLNVSVGDKLFAYVYLDPNNLPSELMLQWNDGSSWEHRVFWGADNISYGTAGTAGHVYAGPLPQAGSWVLLQVPASQVDLEGKSVSGMAFSQLGGGATWDYAGKAAVILSSSTNTNPGVTNTVPGTTNSTPGVTNTVPGVTNTAPGTDSTNTTSGDTNTLPAITNSMPGVSLIDYVTPQLPQVGDNTLHVLTPSLLELKLITTKQPDPAQVTQWNLVNSSAQFLAPPASAFAVTVNGQPVGVASIGFKRRPLYAPIATYDLRIENSLYLQLAGPVSDNQIVEVKNTDGSLWAATTRFVAKVDPLRYSPAIHVNQEGYMPNYSKKAMVGYYAGSMGEMSVPASGGFKLVDANTGTTVFQGSLVQRLDSGYNYVPTPYQKVYEADFTAFNTPGEYRLVIPGMGGSLPFLIHDGISMSFARAYALGLYHQRCGTNTAMPYTRFLHDVCHAAPASVPASASAFPFTWTTIAGYANTLNNNNPPQIAPALTSPAAQLFPFVNQGTVDTRGGHHDAGDYSKYTINSASLVHYLMFAVDSLPGVAELDNLGIPESGDGISDVMQEAKWEADYVAKLQDADGGFYFLVYPQNREYENNVTPDHGDPQVVWPKTTSVTAASVAALAQCATSPAFKKAYPEAAASYLAKAKLGWQFLMNAINKYGKNGAYQKITHYGDNFADNDELAWAACQMYLATGDQSIHQLLLSWFDPSDPATWRWGWWHMSECYGHTMRSYAFAVQSGRATSDQLDPTFLAKCKAQIAAAADDMLSFSAQNAYGSSFPQEAKAVQSAGWYFSADQAFDLAVAYQLNPKGDYLTAMLENMNYEGGCNPVNVCYITGLGWKRQRDIVSGWAVNDSLVLPPSGIPVGNIVGSFGYLWNYGGSLEALCFPSDGAGTAPYPFYDRWGDSWDVNSEMVVLNQARGLGMLAFLAAQGPYKTQAWKAPANATITVPTSVVPVGSTVTATLQAPGLDLSDARITWEARDQEPAFGQTFSFAPKNNGVQWVQAEAQLPDGRRVFATASFNANSPDIVWVDDALPTGAVPGSDGGDSWNWVSSNPTPHSGTLAHQSALAAGQHQHYFANATATLGLATGDVLYCWVYLDPVNPPSEIMLQWNDGTWEHRAYWGANSLGYGQDGTPSRRYMGALPAAGQWVQLKVPASQVNLEGSTLTGMGFAAYGGQVTWDAAGRLSTSSGTPGATVSVQASPALVARTGSDSGVFTITRTGDTSSALPVNYTVGGTAASGLDYSLSSTDVTIPAGATTATVNVTAKPVTNFVPAQTVVLTLASNSSYAVGAPQTASVSLAGNVVPFSVQYSAGSATLTWNSTAGKIYEIAYKDKLTDSSWTRSGQITATAVTSSWVDTTSASTTQRFYMVAQMN